MVQGTGHKEQSPLIEAMGQHKYQCSMEGGIAAQTDHKGQQPQHADGGIGQQPFEIRLQRGQGGSHHHGHRPQPPHTPMPERAVSQHRLQAQQQIDTGLNHGGGMEIGADRGRGHHGRRQPEMEGKQGALGGGPQQDQPGNGRIIVAIPEIEVHQDGRDPEAAGRLTQQDQPRHHGQPAEGGHHQGGQSRFPSALPLVIEADQHKGGQGGHLPEQKQQQQIVRQGHPQHPGHKDKQPAVEAAPARFAGQITPGVKHHQGADPGDQQGIEQA